MTSIAFSHYEAFNPSLEHRFSSGLQLQANYTWAKSIGNASDDAPTAFPQPEAFGPEDALDLRTTRGNDPGTRQQRFLLTFLYELPIGKGKRFLSNSNTVVNAILGGWKLSSITLVETGPYLTPTISAAYSQANLNDLARFGVGQILPDRIGNGNISNPAPNAPWWDINVFVPTPAGAGRVGNSGVGILVGPDTVAISGGLSKVFSITERARLRVEASFTNLPNHPNFASPSTFGQVVTTQFAENSGNRVGQLSARIDF
jgi:hypothetical protein